MKQKNKIQLLLVAAFAGLGVMCYAQQAKMCKDVPGGYNIVSLQDPSDPSSYQWMEDGQDIGGATAAVYTVPSDKAEGKYTYIRRSKKEGCDWASSNAYTVEVITCGSITVDAPIGAKGTVKDGRDGKVYKTVKMPDGKVWMAENLNYQSGLTFNQQSNQANGKPYTDITNGVPAISSFWCPAVAGATLSADRNTCNVYGALYTWETAMSPDGKGTWDESTVLSRYHDYTFPPTASQHDAIVRGICPAGFHLPSDYEWAALLDKVDTNTPDKFVEQVGTGWLGTDAPAGAGDGAGAAVKMKSASTYTGPDPGTVAWLDTDMRGNNITGFASVPAGVLQSVSLTLVGRGSMDYTWSSTPRDLTFVLGRQMVSTYSNVFRTIPRRSYALTVRCIAD